MGKAVKQDFLIYVSTRILKKLDFLRPQLDLAPTNPVAGVTSHGMIGIRIVRNWVRPAYFPQIVSAFFIKAPQINS